MRPQHVVHGLEDGEGPVPGSEGFEDTQRPDPAPEGGVEAFQEVVAHRNRPASVADGRPLELGDDVPGSGDGLLNGRWVGRGHAQVGAVSAEEHRTAVRQLADDVALHAPKSLNFEHFARFYGLNVPIIVCHVKFLTLHSYRSPSSRRGLAARGVRHRH